MTENKFLKLTNTTYKILDFFPESDPLKNRAKDKVLAIMERLVLINETSGWASFQKDKLRVELSEDIDVLLGYLWIGKSQGWLNSVNCLIISNEYEKIKKEVGLAIELTQHLPGLDKKTKEINRQSSAKEELQVLPEESVESVGGNATAHVNNIFNSPMVSRVEGEDSLLLSERHKKILEFLSKNEKAQVMDLQTILPDITKRTIRRDLDELLGAGKIIRQGDFNQVVYKIN